MYALRAKKAAALLIAAMLAIAQVSAAFAADEEYQRRQEHLLPEITVPTTEIELECGEPVPECYVLPAVRQESFPEKYDLREHGRVSPVHNQNQNSLCWAFCTTSAAESNLLGKGISAQLSELQLAYFFGNHVPDPLGLISNDICRPKTDFLVSGGNLFVAANNLAAGRGFVDEADASLEKYVASPFRLPDSLAYSRDSYTATDCILADAADTDRLKRGIMETGECALAFYFDSQNMNYSTSSYYCRKSGEVYNHVVTLVGWDDSYSSENFSTMPPRDGAWIAKNSWGTGWGDEGFFYISYCDKAFSPENNIVGESMLLSVERADPTERIYQYDGGSSSSWIKVSAGKADEAAMFKAQSDCLIKSISFFTQDEDISYSAQIYRNAAGVAPDAGEPCLYHELTGMMEDIGYHTIKLDNPVELSKGECFSIVIKLSRAGALMLPTDMDSDWGWVSFKTENNSGECYMRTPGGVWKDASSAYKCSLRLKCRTSMDTEQLSRVAIGFEGSPAGKPAVVTVTQADGNAISADVMYSTTAHGGVLWTAKPAEGCTVTVSKPGHRTARLDDMPETVILTAGDINDDGSINALDTALVSQAMDGGVCEAADIDDSGRADWDDMYLLLDNFGR